MTDRCGAWTASRVNLITGEVSGGTMWCKSWHCEYCSPIRQRQLMAQAAQGKPNKFITLTSKYRPDEMSPAEAAQELTHAWRMVIQRGKREGIFTECQYIAVFELTEKGWPHLHILARCTFLPQAWLSQRMGEYAESPIVHVRKVDNQSRAAWYIAKYTSKAPSKLNGCKRYWRTLKYGLEQYRREKPLHDHFKGYCNQLDVQSIAHWYAKLAYQVSWEGEHSFFAMPTKFDAHKRERTAFNLKIAKLYREKRQ